MERTLTIDEVIEVNDSGEYDSSGDKLMEVIVEVGKKRKKIEMTPATMIELWRKLGSAIGEAGFDDSALIDGIMDELKI